jgi:hypothetical protein
MDARAERRAMLALLAAFALLVQALWPLTAAAAAGADLGPALQICTGHGLASAPADDQAPAKSAPGHPCQHCICPAVAATPAEPLALAVPARFEIREPRVLAQAAAPPPARAPPRPPGQGPPASNA